MAAQIETQILRELKLGNSPYDSNGSRTCGHLRENAMRMLPEVLTKHGLSLSQGWAQALVLADKADKMDGGDSSLTNVFHVVSYAIQDAEIRKSGGDGVPVEGVALNFHFFHAQLKSRFMDQFGNDMENRRFFIECDRAQPAIRVLPAVRVQPDVLSQRPNKSGWQQIVSKLRQLRF